MTTFRSRDPQARCAIVVGLGSRGGVLGPLIRQLAATLPIDWVIAPDISGCLYQMALREADLLLLSRAAAGSGEALAEILARCRPNFAGCVIIAGDGVVDVYPDRADERCEWLAGPLVRCCDELGWAVAHHERLPPAQAARGGAEPAPPG